MSKNAPIIPRQYIATLNMNGLKGRMLKMPARGKLKREILFIYGHHASLERVYGFAQVLSSYGNVTIPDLPGFGGMDSFYEIGEKPSLDNLADYLASFVKLRYRHKSVTLVGFSFGFTVITRMLQRSPGIVDKVNMLVSIGGFSHRNELSFSIGRRNFYRHVSKLVSTRPVAFVYKNLALRPYIIKKLYSKTYNAKKKLGGLSDEQLRESLEFEIELWKVNDPRTHMLTASSMMSIDNTKTAINTDLWHIFTKQDRYLNHNKVKNNLKKVFRHVNSIKIRSKDHSPSIIASRSDALAYFPPRLKKALAKVQS